MNQLQNSKINVETKGVAYLSTVERGTIRLGDVGFEFEYKSKHYGKNLFFPWESIEQVEINLTMNRKIKDEFIIEIDTNVTFRFSTKDAGAVIKEISQHIGTGKVVRAKNLLNPFRRN